MNFRIDLDISPEEFRRVLGLPDVQDLHKEMLDKLRQQIDSEGFDPTAMMKLYTGGSVEQLQQMMLKLMSGYGSSHNKKDAD